tara:strand:+ start:280 stop:414 length:135 start_codon:yes stop_codon:yes gene_type:complete
MKISEKMNYEYDIDDKEKMKTKVKKITEMFEWLEYSEKYINEKF